MNPIITAHQEIVIENSVRYIELLKSEATKILDEYWETWKARNQLISQTTYANGGKFMPGRFAPVFKKVGSSQKLTIVWKDFSPRFKNKIEHHGVVVKPKLGGYSVREGANKFLIWGCHIHPERIPEGHHEPSTHLRR
ncbi:conjugative transfer protein MobI(A/C) [Klebsiella pneumoniae]|uniref:conjugative transfer protein MobI(A/C) n=1 Tax=Klebsiella pneumoniae TaxID=573 RepID=UPI003EF1A70F